MKSRRDVLVNAIDECLKEVYTLVQPSVEWDDFLKQNKEFLEKEKEYYKIPKKDRPKYLDYMGPKPCEFYYLPEKVFKEVADSYIYAYDLDKHQGLLDTIKILKDYCNKPIVDKYIEGELHEDGTRGPGHRGYDHPDNLIEEVRKILIKYDDHMDSEISEEVVNKFFEFLNMAGEFFNWNGELNSFYTNVHLGPSPNSYKEAVIDNWKQYRNKEIEIDDEKYDDEEQDFD